MLKPRQYQKEGIEFLSNKRYALLADDPGIGKSMQAILACGEIKAKKILVICPAQVKYNWKKEFDKWTPKKYSIGIIDKSTQPVPKTQVVIVNYDLVIRKALHDKLSAMVFDVIINDESHRLKNPQANRTKKVLGKFGLIRRCRRMWFLTGTPVTNRPIDLYPLVARCMNGEFKPYDKYLTFAYRYCGAYQGRFGLVTTGATHLKELGEKIGDFLLRRTKGEVLKELPKRIITHIEFDCTPAVRRLIELEEEETVSLAGDRDPEHFKMGEISRIRRAVAKHKLKDAAGFIEDRLEEDKVVVFFYHKEVRRYLQDKFKKYDPLVIDGSVPAKKRTEIVEKFMTDPKHRVFLGQMEAAGEGIDGLQHASSTCIFVEPSWLPKDMDQCISRLERMGQTKPVNAYILTIRDTIESKMMKLLEWKLQNINIILNDNKTLKTTKQETEMPKKKYLEEKVDELIEKVEALIAICEEQIAHPVQTIDPAAIGGDRTTEAPEPEADPEPEETEAGISIGDVRKLAAAITKADGVNGKNACVKIIEGVGGAGKKLADLTPAELQAVAEQFEEVLSA
ncbi:MAG: DEAD/DEAH box helicase [Deltaproteobacteria bacterium]|nr:DEAD/DEAH box helicase [Deltaproteobacteria bacterium]